MAFFSILLIGPRMVQAAGTSFTLTTKMPNSQINPSVDYFNLLVKPKQVETLTVVLQNQSNHINKITVSPVSTYTNNNGIVDYKRKVTTAKTSAKYQWTDLISPKSVTVNVPAKSIENVYFKLTVPNDTFSGLIDGGFRAISDSDTTTTKAKSGMGIKNQYAMIIGATVQMSKDYVSPDLKLNKVRPGLVSNTTTLLANIENTEPSLFGEMTIDAKVTKRDSDKVLHSAKRSNLSMAPMSNFDYQIDWGREQFKAGKYTLHLTAKSGVKTWKFTRNFTIKSDTADKVNKKGVNLKKPNYWWLWLLLGLLLLLIILFIIWKRRKKDDEEEVAPTTDSEVDPTKNETSTEESTEK